ncbi:kinase-like domain-containing protein [Polychytrium aggregatum]|uniref:kinase-like domain-containing protein n=1 Tax=Polychytrium aggregatum TaxID=110093 RepID=UPI0022FEB07F|nr:kinase-like domain-containing protein [Polychytrium aggregatum]KAI9201803.1 kinase-like domain-containing protein [Polychytrium aggregatum]
MPHHLSSSPRPSALQQCGPRHVPPSFPPPFSFPNHSGHGIYPPATAGLGSTASSKPPSSPFQSIAALPLPSSHSLALQTSDPPIQYPKEFLRQYTLLYELGEGAHGKVMAARRKKDGLPVAAKLFPTRSDHPAFWSNHSELGRVPLEVSIMKSVRHKNLVQLIDYVCEDDAHCIIMELIAPKSQRSLDAVTAHTTTSIASLHAMRDPMDLFQLLQTRPLTDFEQMHIFSSVVEAVVHMSSRGFLHGDIKDENVLVDWVPLVSASARKSASASQKGPHGPSPTPHAWVPVVKLIDFGSSVPYQPNELLPPAFFCGTAEFSAPEIIMGYPSFDGEKCACWSLGVLLYILAFGGVLPFDTPHETCFSPVWPSKFGSGQHHHQPHYQRLCRFYSQSRRLSALSPTCWDLITKLLCKDPALRIGLDELVCHPWMNECRQAMPS